MICFRDMTFCCSKEHNADCKRKWSDQLQADAERWWGGPNPPVAFMALCGGSVDENIIKESRP